MRVQSVRLINCLSIGTYPESELLIEPEVTAIIGKNESGKSNVLDGLSRIRFRQKNQSAFSPNIVNRSNPLESEIEYVITLQSSSDDQVILLDKTVVSMTKSRCSVEGGLLSYYQGEAHSHFAELTRELSAIGQNPFGLNGNDLTAYKEDLSTLLQSDSLDLHRKTQALSRIDNWIGRSSAENKRALEPYMATTKSIWNQLLDLLPVFFLRKASKRLNAAYKLEDVKKELAKETENPNSMLRELVKLIGISHDEFIEAASPGSEPRKLSLRRKINNNIDAHINNPFADFYKTEAVCLELDFNSGVASFTIRSNNGEALALSERSNGLRWYLETFIDARAHNISGRNVVYLFDEPGSSLHVNAQKELVRLFEHLAAQGNQVVYSTHSPFMLDLDNFGIHRIRAVVKDSDGYTKLYKTAYDSQIAPECRQDTLAPIISALGMSLQDTFGPALGKLNIVVEGISDYIYLNMMAKVLDIDMRNFAIIPALGASKVANICSILLGWGCDYLALFDYDKAGVENGERMRKEMLAVLGKHYCYLADVNQDDVDRHSYESSCLAIEELITPEEIERFCLTSGISNDDHSKALTAKLMNDSVSAGNFALGDECRANFQALFGRIMLIRVSNQS